MIFLKGIFLSAPATNMSITLLYLNIKVHMYQKIVTYFTMYLMCVIHFFSNFLFSLWNPSIRPDGTQKGFLPHKYWSQSFHFGFSVLQAIWSCKHTDFTGPDEILPDRIIFAFFKAWNTIWTSFYLIFQ